MQHSSVNEIESKVVPGVKFTLRRISYGRRGKIREILTEATAGVDEKDIPAMARAGNFTDRQSYILLVKDITGVEIDGEPATPATQFDDGDPALTEEIMAAVSKEMGLSDTESKTSPASSEAVSPAAAGLN